MAQLSEEDRIELRKKIKQANEMVRRLSKEYEKKYGGNNRYALWGFIIGFIVGGISVYVVITLDLINRYGG